MGLTAEFNTEPALLEFHPNGESVGKLINKAGVLSFEGDAEESAKCLFDYIVSLNNSTLMKYKTALEKISSITDAQHYCGDLDKIEEARLIAKEALE